MRTVSALVILILCFWTLPAFGQESTPDNFAKFCADIEGRWVGNITWITDWPGLGKKGDKVTSYWEGRTSEDSKLLIGKFFGGNGSETAMTFYDPAKKRIRSVGVASGGTIAESTVYLKDGNWIQETEFTLPDGTKGRLKSIGTITDGGNTWTWKMNGKIGDDVVKGQKDSWRRVSK